VHDLDDVWRDDQLIEALANGEPVDTTDPAVAPLRALTGLVDAEPIPDYDIRGLENIVMLDTGRSRRLAVRSLAVALTAVATLSTSGVAAVVTGDPFQPAKAVWHQIQERAGDRWGVDRTFDEDRLDSGSAVGGDTGDSGEAVDTGGSGGTRMSAQSAVFEAARQRADDGPPRLQRVDLNRPSRSGLKAAPAPSQDRAVAEADATDESEAAQPAPSPSTAEEPTAEERQASQEESASGTATTSEDERSAQQREDAQRAEEEQESQDSRRSEQPEEDEQEPTTDAPEDDFDSGIIPDGTDEYTGDDDDSMRSTEESDETEDDTEESDGTTYTDPAPEEDTSSTEESTEEESEDDGPWANWYVEQRAGSTDETVAPPRLDR
jgi:Anti-sigma-D factor RsdA to sigma factor binding region